MTAALLSLFLLAAPEAPGSPAAVRADVVRRAEALARPLLAGLCGERCTLLRADAQVVEEEVKKDALPGFESLAQVERRVNARRLTLDVATDAELSAGAQKAVVAALETALVDLAAVVEVKTQPLAWAPQRPPPVPPSSPVVVTMQPAPAVPVAAPSLEERWQASLAEAAPWVLGLWGAALLFGWALRRRQVAPGASSAPPRALAETTSPGQAHETGRLESSILEGCRQNPALGAAVWRRLLEGGRPGTELGPLAPLLGEAALAILQDDPTLVPALVALSRSRTGAAVDPGRVAELEGIVLHERHAGLHDARFAFLQGLSAEAFGSLLLRFSGPERAALLALGPAAHRRAHVAGLAAPERQAALSSTLATALEPELLDALAGPAQAAARAAREEEAAERRAAELLQDQLDGLPLSEQAALLGVLSGQSQTWLRVIERHVVTEQHVAEADDELLRALCVAVPPEALAAFLAVAAEGLRRRLVAAAPSFVRSALGDLAAQPPEAQAEGRRAVLSAFKELRRAAARRGAAADPAGEPDAGATRRRVREAT